jgi:hypothetical protein
MLPANLWHPWQPRVSFPFFSGVENTFEFTVQPSLKIQGWRNFAYPAYTAYKKQKTWGHALRDYAHILSGNHIYFDVHRLKQDGTYIKSEGRFGPFGIGQSFVFKSASDPKGSQGLMLFVASRGRLDKMTSSPGNMTVRYASPEAISGYRTGFFARPLNEKKGHYGYMGLNPALSQNPKMESGILLINHSSDPEYNTAVSPTVRLYKSHDEFIETDFGAIAPHGFLEKGLHQLFPQFETFRADAKNLWTVSNCKGVSLASFHTYRNLQGQLMAIEHSRPSHAQVIQYWKQK